MFLPDPALGLDLAAFPLECRINRCQSWCTFSPFFLQFELVWRRFQKLHRHEAITSRCVRRRRQRRCGRAEHDAGGTKTIARSIRLVVTIDGRLVTSNYCRYGVLRGQRPGSWPSTLPKVQSFLFHRLPVAGSSAVSARRGRRRAGVDSGAPDEAASIARGRADGQTTVFSYLIDSFSSGVPGGVRLDVRIQASSAIESEPSVARRPRADASPGIEAVFLPERLYGPPSREPASRPAV
ncbi:hypothetical protein EVAR_92934_1 [Eumeta japonica]|uniref:Uncharacterized protein n=1 Tax=Eumeta variegata TaxID=151549 RepID=A0A4C1TA98_EUMVA|nr:hypothetical protein EVAR_92934_1 [Eumeta japonica]